MQSVVIKLPQPIERVGSSKKIIKQITINEPTVSALQGLEVMAVIRGDVSQLMVLLPRITQDLTESEIKKLSFKNLAAISMRVTSFLG